MTGIRKDSLAGKAVPSILVLRGGALGDLVLTLPAMKLLRDSRPEARVTLAGRMPAAALAAEGGLVDSVINLDGADLVWLFSADTDPSPVSRRWGSDFDLAVSFLPDADGAVRRNLLRSGVRKVLSVPQPDGTMHAADHFVAAMDLPARGPQAAVPGLQLREKTLRAGTELLAGIAGPVCVLHPGSGSRKKNWPVGRFIELAGRIENEMVPVFTVGEADEEVYGQLTTSGMSHRVTRGKSLLDVAGMLAAAGACVGNDSGISHLAAALGVPTVALFGPTDPAVWAPRGRRVRVLRSDPPTTEGLGYLAVDPVRRALQDLMRLR